MEHMPDSLFVVELKEKLPKRELAIAYNSQLPVSRATEEFLSYFE